MSYFQKYRKKKTCRLPCNKTCNHLLKHWSNIILISYVFTFQPCSDGLVNIIVNLLDRHNSPKVQPKNLSTNLNNIVIIHVNIRDGDDKRRVEKKNTVRLSNVADDILVKLLPINNKIFCHISIFNLNKFYGRKLKIYLSALAFFVRFFLVKMCILKGRRLTSYDDEGNAIAIPQRAFTRRAACTLGCFRFFGKFLRIWHILFVAGMWRFTFRLWCDNVSRSLYGFLKVLEFHVLEQRQSGITGNVIPRGWLSRIPEMVSVVSR